MKTKTYNRYHRYDLFGNKQIKRVELNETVTDIPDIGFTVWTKGTGPHTYDNYIKVSEGIRRACKGVPKSDEQKLKMRQAKLGVPKSELHKQNMRKSYLARRLINKTN